MADDADCLYSVEELAERAGVTRRTVRYYVQRGLLPAPLGLGRGRHYTASHLETLIRIRELQEASVPLEDIALRLQGPSIPEPARVPVQTTWTRLVLAEGIELHLRNRRLTEEQVGNLTAMVEKLMGEVDS